MECRRGCGACCIAISISSAIPGLPSGKIAGIRCVNLSNNNDCQLHHTENYPAVCKNLRPSEEMCGCSFEYAFDYLTELEILTKP